MVMKSSQNKKYLGVAGKQIGKTQVLITSRSKQTLQMPAGPWIPSDGGLQ
jgi:hypothetical protein